MSTLIWDDEYILQHIWLYKSYAYDSIRPLGPDQENFLILTWGEASGQIENASLLFRSLSFKMLGYLASLVCVTKPGVPYSEIDRKIMNYSENDNKATLYLY
jgi:hypothetical protein